MILMLVFRITFQLSKLFTYPNTLAQPPDQRGLDNQGCTVAIKQATPSYHPELNIVVLFAYLYCIRMSRCIIVPHTSAWNVSDCTADVHEACN